ncbi:MAG: DUF4139 domain-containing protein, partial [Chitinophagales bacterium]
MKKLIYVITLLFSAHTFAQNQLTVQTQPDKAVVFLNGAQLYHSKQVQLAAGLNDVIFEGIPNSVDANSLQAGGKGVFTILDIQYRMQYPEPVTNTNPLPDAIQKKIKLLQDSIKNKNYEVTDVNYQIEVLNYQKSMMLNSKLLSGGGKTDSIQLLKDAIAFYGEKLNVIYSESLKLDKARTKLYEDINAMNVRLGELNNYWYQQNKNINPNVPIPQIVVSINAETGTSATVDMNYVTYNAGWYATYDIRATEVGKPVQLNYKANIWQSTGIDWKNVKLTCSTGNPMLGNNLPELTTWYIGYYQQYYERDHKKDESMQEPSAMDAELNSTMGSIASGRVEDDAPQANYSYNYTTALQTIANVEFEINLTYNIPSDGKGHLVSLQSETLKSDYNYLIVPKIDQSAFLIARITEWEDKNLLPGNANIYFNNTYVGKTYIDPLALSDTLSLSLGRDKSIEVKRTQVSDKTTDRIIGVNNTKSLAY